MSLNGPRHIAKVPLEIWLECFEYLAPTARQTPLPQDVESTAVREGVAWVSPCPHALYHLSQVCVLFNQLAMRVARRRLVIGPSHDIEFWVQSLSKRGGGDVVKRVEINNLHSGLLEVLIRLLPNVTDMYLRHCSAAITRIPPLNGSLQPGFQRLTDLTLSGLSAFATMQVLCNLSTVAKTLERLWLVQAMRGDANPTTAGTRRYTFANLQWLIVGAPGRRFQPGRADEPMREILTALTGMFELPRIKRFDNLDALGYQASFFIRFGQQLEAIAITSEDYDLDTHGNFPLHCPNLKTVIIVIVLMHLRICSLALPEGVNRLVLRSPELLPWQVEEQRMQLLRRALYDSSRRSLSCLKTIAISGMTHWGRSSGWFCRRVKYLREEGVEVIETM
ncbi:hypothetical protein DFP72DRAFT_1073324 [Ephemerocybe angulata]|uniref:F-box domain-containing protein n=1 Tax=Ephemerocybe angulata TaxID=980116 RepID=A0A8H6M2H6_9AGAR|nr:hypothetical protein DFP72DRAFT_1073324 [Tulosesus angulatus]